MVVEYPYYPDVEPLHLECEHFLQCLVTGERPRTDANNAYQVVSILADVEKRLSGRVASRTANPRHAINLSKQFFHLVLISLLNSAAFVVLLTILWSLNPKVVIGAGLHPISPCSR